VAALGLESATAADAAQTGEEVELRARHWSRHMALGISQTRDARQNNRRKNLSRGEQALWLG